jgi:riboflavin kinase/FMN adenylyltransferase
LAENGKRQGFAVLETKSCVLDGERVSSTVIRTHLGSGNFARVEELLGRPYAISGEVVRGLQLGTDLGFPTCNINLHRRRIPLHGVFACQVHWQGKILAAAVNIGYRPTISDSGDALLEVHLLNFTGDLYGEALSVVFCHKIREEQKFPDLKSLKEQIARDVGQIREYFGL